MAAADYAPLDAALDVVARHGPDLQNGLTSHAPMAVEALCALGRADAVLPWLETYRKGMTPRPGARTRIARDDWREALGKPDRFADWCVFFAAELAEAPWADVAARWAARLAPGICASATHGVIRAGHAVRSLDEAKTPARVRELADGLAYWAAEYQTLPTARTAPGTLAARDAIARVPIVRPAERVFTGTIVSSLAALDGFPPFAPVIDLVDARRDPSAAISDLSETFARVCLANAKDLLSTIVFVHGVTSVAALRSLLPHLPAAAVPDALAYAWQSGCGLYTAFATAPAASGDVTPPPESVDTLVDMAVANGDEHAIKLAEACVREHALNPSPAYLVATKRATTLLVAR